MAKISQFLKRTSARSGFDGLGDEFLKDGPYLVLTGEFDTPPPSTKSLGGEGEVSGTGRTNSDFATSGTANILAVTENPTFYITAGGGITPNLTHPYMRISGSNSAINITADPQIVRGKEGNVLTLLCVGSNITLDHGTGLNLMGSAGFVMNSGSVITFIYTTDNTAWNETSRSGPDQGFGG